LLRNILFLEIRQPSTFQNVTFERDSSTPLPPELSMYTSDRSITEQSITDQSIIPRFMRNKNENVNRSKKKKFLHSLIKRFCTKDY